MMTMMPHGISSVLLNSECDDYIVLLLCTLCVVVSMFALVTVYTVATLCVHYALVTQP